MTQLHHSSLFFVFLSLSLTIKLPFTSGLSPRAPVASPYGNPEPVPLESTASQPLVPQSIYPIDNSSNASNNDPYKCFRESPFAPNRPSYVDCLSAIRRLPDSPTPGMFQYVGNLHVIIPSPISLTVTASVDLSIPSDYLAPKPSHPAA